MKTVAIIQARMGSSRLSGKVMKELYGKPVLSHVINRVRQCKEVDEVVVATTTSEVDDIFTETDFGVSVYRGSEDNVLSRYYETAKATDADIVVRITSDCPLIDPNIIDEMLTIYKQGNYKVVTNATSNLEDRTFPRGLDAEIFSFEYLEEAYNNATEQYQKEHVTPYLYENTDSVYIYKNDVNYSKYRLTLDTDEDFVLIHKVYGALYSGEHDFYLKEIVETMEANPDWIKINEHIEQKKTK